MKPKRIPTIFRDSWAQICAPIVILFFAITATAATPKTSTAHYTPYRITIPCNKSNDSCAKTLSEQLTTNYRNGVAQYHIPNPTDSCNLINNGCNAFRNDWQNRVKNNIENKSLSYDPGGRPWLNKTCRTVNSMGMSRIVCTGGS